jgi:hypothetical protein
MVAVRFVTDVVAPGVVAVAVSVTVSVRAGSVIVRVVVSVVASVVVSVAVVAAMVVPVPLAPSATAMASVNIGRERAATDRGLTGKTLVRPL